MTSATDRRVRHVRLRGRDESLVSKGVILLSDAFRTAAIPGDDGRLYVFRSLPLGSFRSGISPGTLALRIESRIRELRAAAVYAASADASDAPAVYFADPVEPVCLLAERVARGSSLDEWFWTLAVPAWRPGMSRAETIRALLLALISVEGGLVAIAALVDRLLAAGGREVLLDSLQSSADAAALTSFAGWQPPSRAARLIAFDAHAATTRSTADLPVSYRATVRRAVERWGADDPRSFCVACLIEVATKPALWDRPSVPAAALRHLADASAAPREGAPASGRLTETPEPVSSSSASTDSVPHQLLRNETEYGGLFFLLTILQHLGISDVIGEPELAGRVLALCACRLHIPHRDPVWQALPRRDFSERQLPDPAAAHWLSAARSWCRRHARIGLVKLTARRAVVTASRTHLNIVFRHMDADVRIRRCGLDIDPGWLPWFGRVVRFYYADDEEWHGF